MELDWIGATKIFVTTAKRLITEFSLLALPVYTVISQYDLVEISNTRISEFLCQSLDIHKGV